MQIFRRNSFHLRRKKFNSLEGKKVNIMCANPAFTHLISFDPIGMERSTSMHFCLSKNNNMTREFSFFSQRMNRISSSSLIECFRFLFRCKKNFRSAPESSFFFFFSLPSVPLFFFVFIQLSSSQTMSSDQHQQIPAKVLDDLCR